MNNWDKRPELVVVQGDEIPYQYLVDTGNHLVSKETSVKRSYNHTPRFFPHTPRFFPAQSSIMEDFVVYQLDEMNVPHINMALEGLADHIEHTKREDWMVRHGTVVLEEDRLFMEVYVGTYYGQNCKIKVYEVTIG